MLNHSRSVHEGGLVSHAVELTRGKSVRLVIGICIGFEILLVLLDASANLKGWVVRSPIRKLFNIALETSIPTWFAVIQAAAVGAILGLIAFLKRRQGGGGHRAWMGWMAMAVFFTYMSLDDGSKLHERVGSVFRSGSVVENTVEGEEETVDSFTLVPSFPSYSWQLVLMPFFALFGLYMLLFLWQELDQGEFKWVIMGLACYAFAVGLDFVEGFDHLGNQWNIYPLLAEHGNLDASTIRHMLQSLEEFVEMLGTTVFLGLFLNHLMLSTNEIRIRFRQ